MGSSVDAEGVAKRAAILFAGLGYLILAMAKHTSNPTRQKISEAVILLLLGLAILGMYEWFRRIVGPGIWLAIFCEIPLAALFAVAWRSPQNKGQRQ